MTPSDQMASGATPARPGPGAAARWAVPRPPQVAHELARPQSGQPPGRPRAAHELARPKDRRQLQIKCKCGYLAIRIDVMDLPVLAPRRGLRSLFRRGPHDAEILRLAVPAFGAL